MALPPSPHRLRSSSRARLRRRSTRPAARRLGWPFRRFSRCPTTPKPSPRPRTISDVLWDDLNYEHEFSFVARDIYTTIPAAKSIDDPPLDRWREVDADGVVVGSVQKSGSQLLIRYRLYNVRSRRSCSGPSSPDRPTRGCTRTRSPTRSSRSNGKSGRRRADETELQLRSRRRAPRRDRSKTAPSSEIYISDYDGENQRRVTVGRTLNSFPTWSPDARSIAYASWRRGAAAHLRLAHLRGHADELTKGPSENYNARVVARRHAHRVLVDARRQPRDLRRQQGRIEPAPADQLRRRSTSRRPGRRTETKSRSPPIAPARRRSTSVRRRARQRPAVDHRVLSPIGPRGRRRPSTRSRSRRATDRATISR